MTETDRLVRWCLGCGFSLIGLLAVPGVAGSVPDRAAWMRQGRWGVMTHYLADWRARVDNIEMSVEQWNNLIDHFDVEGLAQQIESVGAGYYLITIGQNSGYYLSPNATYDRLVGIQPSKCSRRDLVADLYEALSKRGIRLMVYLPAGAPGGDAPARKVLQWQNGPYPNREFQVKWEEVIREWSHRWGKKVAGWWFDGCYWPNTMYRGDQPPNFASFAAAARAGNPDSVVAFNPGVVPRLISVSPHEDYTAGEISDPNRLEIRRQVNGRLDGAQVHVLSYLGRTWGMGEPRAAQEQVVAWSRKVADAGGAITWDVPIQANGLISQPFIDQLTAVGKALSGGRAGAAAPMPSDSRTAARKIDRHALVTRHNVTLAKPDPLTPLSVGNGEFAFTADITGLQTFPEFHQKGMPLGTQSQWGWHTIPSQQTYRLADILEEYDVAGRKVPYASDRDYKRDYSPAAAWLRANPHRLDLGRIGLHITKSDGSPAAITDLTNTTQMLDLWTGLLTSRFEIEGQPVKVLTVCHPERDMLAVRIESPLVSPRLFVRLAFPYGNADWRNAADWQHPQRHTTQSQVGINQADFARTLDADHYSVRVAWSPGCGTASDSEHEFNIYRQDGQPLEVVYAFSGVKIVEQLPDFEMVRGAAAGYWEKFWTNGGAVDFSECTDRRAAELERRVVLSQYLTAIQCSGSRPPQETGLVHNSWFGKFHLEMHWWHAAHFALWDRAAMLERSLPWYQSILPAAKATAAMQGYQGTRWPKMTSPDGRESPSTVGVFLIWQQPHPIYYAELCYRAHGDKATLEKYHDLVFETAEFMASYPVWDEAGKRYVLGPAMIPAQESYGRYRRQNLNPTFELAYWHWALDTAQKWRQRLGLERDPKWDRVIQNLSRPTIRDGVYTGIETSPYTIAEDHPSMLGALGFVPQTPLIDPNTMKRTLDMVLRTWDWPSTWGWDYPMLAMTAARLGEPDKAVDALFIVSEKNRYLANGHNYQSARLPLYLPGNGGLLAAAAMMAAGWDGCPDRPNPGFPDDGKWTVRWEGLKRMP